MHFSCFPWNSRDEQKKKMAIIKRVAINFIKYLFFENVRLFFYRYYWEWIVKHNEGLNLNKRLIRRHDLSYWSLVFISFLDFGLGKQIIFRRTSVGDGLVLALQLCYISFERLYFPILTLLKIFGKKSFE